ncbi:DUF2285 domain-containing protein [Novosphingobium sp. BW1]|uniref:DUF2285 domain-containing protein n=1 Tax=Novosphingobium sp. BW1 TaxID=2592621 RepID=UPI0011DE9720|nr:DUF2285 domain-containing protein [Novosphingobium sp. BW1]TYC98010.1 DUF2285 domain-containing protein [Novosphingobium sp. BW1]
MRGRAALPAAASIRARGGCTFAEDPARSAPEARIIWHADLDPGTLCVEAIPTDRADPDGLDLERVAAWLTVVTDPDGYDHAVLSDGRHHIRLDAAHGRLAGETLVHLHYRLHGLSSAEAGLLPLRRLLHLQHHRRFARSLYPRDPWIERGIQLLRVHDALADGATQREIGAVLFGEARVAEDWNDRSDSLRSRIRRLVREAKTLALGGYRDLMRRQARLPSKPHTRAEHSRRDPA